MNETNHTTAEADKQSKLGIAAAIITVMGMGCFGLYIVWFASSSPIGPLPIEAINKLFGVLNFAIEAAMAAALVGGILGLVSLFQKNQKKTFGIAALILAALILCGSCGIYAWAFLTPK